MIKNCLNCKKRFNFWPYETKTVKYCSRKCRKEFLRIKVACLNCKKEFNYYQSQKRKFCSKSCANSFNQSGDKSNNWTGGRTIRTFGYIAIWQPHHPFSDNNGYVVEHRLVIEKSLGRFLKSGEVVHHLNGNTADNRLKNLKLFASHSDHMKKAHPNHTGHFKKTVGKINIICKVCNKNFIDYKTNTRTFCSQKCSWQGCHK